MSTNPWPDYFSQWESDPRVIKAVPCNSLDNIFANRLHGWSRYDPRYHAYDAALDAFRVRIYKGERSLPIAAQWITPITYPQSWSSYECVTFVWQECWPYNAHSGKVYQFVDTNINYEYAHVPGVGPSEFVVPHWRSYSVPSPVQGPDGRQSFGWHPPNTGGYLWHQPALYPRGHRNYGEHILQDHIGFPDEQHPQWGTPQYKDNMRCYLKRVRSAQWHFNAVTFTLNDPDGVRFHQWIASQGNPADGWPATPLTKLVDAPPGNPDQGKGFLHHTPGRFPINQFWVEINNSQGDATDDTQFYFKDFMVIGNVKGDEIWNAAINIVNE
jgi:hypothetical protein